MEWRNLIYRRTAGSTFLCSNSGLVGYNLYTQASDGTKYQFIWIGKVLLSGDQGKRKNTL